MEETEQTSTGTGAVVVRSESVRFLLGRVTPAGPRVAPVRLTLACACTEEVGSAELRGLASELAAQIGQRMLWHRDSQQSLLSGSVQWEGPWTGPRPPLLSWRSEPTLESVALWIAHRVLIETERLFGADRAALAAVELGGADSTVVVHPGPAREHGHAHGPQY